MFSDKLTIGYVLDDTLDVSDGVQQAMISIAENMRSLGHDVHYIVSETKRTDLKNIHNIGKVWAVKFNGNSVRTPLPASVSKIKKLFADVDFDVLHVQMPYSPMFVAKVINQAPSNVKIFGTFHILPYNSFSKLGTKMLGMALSKSNKRIDQAYAVSKPALEFMSEDFGLSGLVLPNPVDYDFFNKAKPYVCEKLSIVFVGRFEERKGVEQLIKAYELLDDMIKNNVDMTLCGKGPDYDRLVQYSTDQNLDINFAGFVSEEEKAGRLAGADIAIFPSTSGESFGIVLTEAMAAGAGVTLGGNNPGYASVLGDWPLSLFDATNPESIAAKLTEFIEDKKLRNHIGKLQHQEVKQYDINIICKKLLNDYVSSK